ncbi:unnamed protein product [Chilo suppressalis]|uniref:PHD-type domain-containing protein n=1 Tax=Chilo suppressalis TaxID=168631 RepID=A0ABN8BFP9_CHISP|nr:unnamed protein product [Chilo suppressalis]
MVKCAACGKFLSQSESVRCCKCNSSFHKACVAIPNTASVKDNWTCPGCKVMVPRVDNTSTPVRGVAADYVAPPGPVCLDGPASNTTEDLKLDFALEIRSFRSELKTIREEIRECRLEVSEIKAVLTSFDSKIGDIENRVSVLETKCEQMETPNLSVIEETIANLQSQLNDREQELLANDIEVSGIPEKKGEILHSVVMELSTKLGVPFDERDVVHMERVGSVRRNRIEGSDDEPGEQRPRLIVVRFARRTARDQWLRAARIRRNINTEGVDAPDCQNNSTKVPNKPRNVYVNERLSRRNRQLFFLSRREAKKNNWKYVWTSGGRVLARKGDGNSVVLIRTEKDISKIF